ncbi:P-loop NTPase family protein [Thermosipho atlanticus]|uniref:KAP family P-loop domain-containing protein n=1 Tax=Thermosipho atlanticus DSM 15807 TaxID=1123380 RepID=A0A1M5RND4_9BACT|nr:P-loop NTPase fold protein [Thermosipho atlanticus]SHH27588.1 KAP family P-loop domain-containing protein [Thermosipho atlanticus DSM 15807]
MVKKRGYEGDYNYKVFVFDVWAELGHKFRQAFLLKFLDWGWNEFKEKGVFQNSEDCKVSYEGKRLEILGKKRELERTVKPNKESAVIHLFIIILMLTIVPSLISVFLGYLSLGFLRSLSLLSIYSFPLTIILTYYLRGLKEVQSHNQRILKIWFTLYFIWLGSSIVYLNFSGIFRNENILGIMLKIILVGAFIIYFTTPFLVFVKTLKEDEGITSIVSMYSGLLIGKFKELEETRTLDNNSLDFKREFLSILECIRKVYDGKIIIVIDNVDRIPENKVDEVFATLKPFMVSDEVEEKPQEEKNVFYIIPFDPDGIRIGKDKGGYDYFNKLFKKEFYVPEPIYGSWQSYFEKIQKKLGLDIPSYIFEISIHIAIDFKNYVNYANNSEKTDLNINNDEENNEKEIKEFHFKIDTKFVPPTPREIKKFLNNLITIIPPTINLKSLNTPQKNSELFSYTLFSALKTYGILNSSDEVEKFFIEKFKDDKSIFELYLLEKGYTTYSFIDFEELVYRIYALYHNTNYENAFRVLNLPKLEKIFSEPFYDEQFKEIVSDVPDSFKENFKSAIESLINRIIDKIYSNEPQIILSHGKYLKDLKEIFPDLYEKVKESFFEILINKLEEPESFVFLVDDKIFSKFDKQLINKKYVLESIMFIQKESNINLINTILKFSEFKGEIVTGLIKGLENESFTPEILNSLEENVFNPENDAKHVNKILEFIGEFFKERKLKHKEQLEQLIKTMNLTKTMIEESLKLYETNIGSAEKEDKYAQLLNFLKGIGLIVNYLIELEEEQYIISLILSKFSSIFQQNLRTYNTVNSSVLYEYIKFILTYYVYFYSKENERTNNIIRNLVQDSINLFNSIPQNQEKIKIASLLALFLLVFDKTSELQAINNVFNLAVPNFIVDNMKEYSPEIDNICKTENISDVYKKISSKLGISSIKNLYETIYEYLLETEETNLCWILKFYSFLIECGISKENIEKVIKKLYTPSLISSCDIRLEDANIKLWCYLFELSNRDKTIFEKFENELNSKPEFYETTLFTNSFFYECCVKNRIELNKGLHKYIFNGLINNLEKFKNIRIITDFLLIQNDLFLKPFLETFKYYITRKARETEDNRGVAEEINSIFEKFNEFSHKLKQQRPKIFKEVFKKPSEQDFVEALEGLAPELPKAIKEFVKLL